MGAGVKAAEHGRYTTPTDDVRRRHGLLPPRTGLIYRIMMAHGGVPHSHGELIHRSAWNRNSRKFRRSTALQRWSHELGVVLLVYLLHGPASARAPIRIFSMLGQIAANLRPCIEDSSRIHRRMLQ